jgi:P27 family predicted phage terminase small subunit
LSPAGRSYYRHYGRQLEAGRVITHVDRDALAIYAATLADIAELSKAMRGRDFQRTLSTDTGVKTNPLVTQYERAKGQARQLAQDLGITPASRSRVQPATPASQDGGDQARRETFFRRPTLVKGATRGA